MLIPPLKKAYKKLRFPKIIICETNFLLNIDFHGKQPTVYYE